MTPVSRGLLVFRWYKCCILKIKTMAVQKKSIIVIAIISTLAISIAVLASRMRPSSVTKDTQASSANSEIANDSKKDQPDHNARKESQASNNQASQANSPKEEVEKLYGIPIGKRNKLNVTTQIQQRWNFCAPATVSMMLASRGKIVDQFTLAREMGTYEPFGTHNRDAIRILNKHMFGYEFPQTNQAGYRIETVREINSASIELFKQRIIKNTQDGYPMYYTFNPGKIYPGIANAEHNVAGAGYIATPDNKDVALVYYVDPYYKFQDPIYGGLKVVTPEELLNAMVGVSEPDYAW